MRKPRRKRTPEELEPCAKCGLPRFQHDAVGNMLNHDWQPSNDSTDTEETLP